MLMGDQQNHSHKRANMSRVQLRVIASGALALGAHRAYVRTLHLRVDDNGAPFNPARESRVPER